MYLIFFQKSIDKNKCSIYNTNIPNKHSQLKGEKKMKLKIVNKKKFTKSISMVSLFIIAILVWSTNIYSKESINYKNEYIITGDTLWSIAQKEAKENIYYKNKDIRDIVRDIKKINHLQDGNIYDGQQIKIPIVY